MKKRVWKIVIFALSYIIASNFFIYIVPPTEKELVGKYFSKFEDKEYTLIISKNKISKFEVRENGKIIYKDECKNYHIEKAHYRTFPVYNIAFSKCIHMDSNADIERGLMFNLLIGNNGAEMERIDPDSRVYYKKQMR